MLDLQNFDPNAVGLQTHNIFGLPSTVENSELIIIPVPWEVTVSFREGTANGPNVIREDSYQVDLYDADAPEMWKYGYYMCDIPESIHILSKDTRSIALEVIQNLEDGRSEDDPDVLLLIDKVNKASRHMIDWVEKESTQYLQQGKQVILLGGDHSTPLGMYKSIGKKFGPFSLLQIDAHADLRQAYEGFQYSHASIMYNTLQEVPEINKLVQVGIRDYCDEELERIESDSRITTYFDSQIKRSLYRGESLHSQWQRIVDLLDDQVYISFDIDGLDPKLCPHTGTPVPGGFDFDEISYLFALIVESGKTIIGMDLNEVSSPMDEPNTDSLVGARMLYKMCNLMMKSHHRQ